MPRLKNIPIAAVVFTLAVGACAAHAETPPPPPNTAPIAADHHNDSLTERGLATAGNAASKIGSAIGNGAHAFGSGVQRAKDRATALIKHAMSAIGVPYRFGGTSSATGFDCSGFVQTMYRQTLGKLLPRSAAEQAAVTQTISKDDLQPGDLVFFNTVRRRAYSHVGIYVGDGQFIHAPSRHERVRIDDLSAAYWQKHFEGARRVLTDDSFPNGGGGIRLVSASAADGLIVPPGGSDTSKRRIATGSDDNNGLTRNSANWAGSGTNNGSLVVADNAPAGATGIEPAASQLAAPVPAPVTVTPPATPPATGNSTSSTPGKQTATSHHTGKHSKAKAGKHREVKVSKHREAKVNKHGKAKTVAKSKSAGKSAAKTKKSSSHTQSQHKKHTKKK